VTVYPNRIEMQPRRRGPLSAGIAETIPLRMVSTVSAQRLFLRRFAVSVTAAGNVTTFRAKPGDARRFREAVSALIVTNA
jgi:hypothetical protein